jgi:translocation and assembly module TamB
LSGGARIAGTLTLGQTDVQVPSSGVGSLGDLPDIVHIGQSGSVQQTLDNAGVIEPGTAEVSSSGGAAFPLDITVNAPSRIFIRGRGLDAELGGSLSLGGTTANVIPVGQFSLIRGRLDILQQRFELAEGDASLQGDFAPYIRLVAETEARTGTQIRIVVEGPAEAPEVSFESTPQLPQDEVLAQLIFGRNLSEISPLQAVQLAAAVGTLAGRGGGGLIDGFRQELGLDDFDVTTDDDGNAAVRAGAYLSENVYTDVTINSEGETEINLNLDITSEITAKGTVDADGETSIGIFFERDY